MLLNMDMILNTPEKKLIREYRELKSSYTKQGAIQYYNSYSDKPVSFILDMAKYIYSEPYKGFYFYYNLIDGRKIPIYQYEVQKNKLERFINEQSRQMGSAQRAEFNKLLTLLNNRIFEYGGSIERMTGAITDDIIELHGTILGAYDEYNKGNYEEAMKYLGGRLDTLPDYLNLAFLSGQDSASMIMDNIKSIQQAGESEEEMEGYRNQLRLANTLKRIIQADYFRKKIMSLPGNVRLNILELSETDEEVIHYNKTTVHESLSEAYTDPQTLIDSMYENAIFDEMNSSIYSEDKIHNLLLEKTLLEMRSVYLYNDFINEPDFIVGDGTSLEMEETFEDSVKANAILSKLNSVMERINEIESTLESMGVESDVVLEYYNTGAQGRVIRTTHEDDIEEPEGKNSPRNGVYKKSQGKSQDRDSDYDDENRPKCRDDGSTVDPDKPPKEGMIRSIQNKAIDADMKFKKGMASAKEKAQGAKNAVKAVAKVPANIKDSVNKQIQNWDDMDDERRKEYIIKPGFRKKYWRALKIAIMHGLVFKINPLLNIILFICSKLSKEKNKRIRNELVMELDTEMKVIDQKIDDAKSKGDNKAVYKMIRMRDKLRQEKIRVSTNTEKF